MATVERVRDRGSRQAAGLIAGLGTELRDARIALNLSQSAVADGAGVSHSAISRIERGASPQVAVSRLAVVASTLGLRLSIKAYPAGSPLRDAAQLELLGRLRAAIHPGLTWRSEVPIPQEGDLRAWDASITGGDWTAYVDAETRIRDAQALERRTNLKRRDTMTDRVLLLVADTRSNRAVLRAIGMPLIDDAIDGRMILARLAAGTDPAGSGIVLL